MMAPLVGIYIDFFRQRNCGTFEEFADVMTDQVNDCIFEVSKPSLKVGVDLYDLTKSLDYFINSKFDNLSEDEQDQSPLMVLGCSYCDYIIFIDLDTKTPNFFQED